MRSQWRSEKGHFVYSSILARSRRVWGGWPQQAVLWFVRKGKSIKHASAYTLALLATLCKALKIRKCRKSLVTFITIIICLLIIQFDKRHKNIVYNFRDCLVGNFLFRDQIILQQVNR